MSPERPYSPEQPLTITTRMTTLNELNIRCDDLANLRVDSADIAVVKESSLSEDHYRASFDVPLGPNELRRLLSFTVPTQTDDELEDFRTPNAMQLMYETVAFSSATIPGNDFADLERLRQRALSVLDAPTNRPESEMNKQTLVYTLLQLELDLKTNPPITPKLLKRTLFSENDSQYYQQLLRSCGLTPKYSKDAAGNYTVFSRMQNAVIERLMRYPDRLITFLTSLPQEQRRHLTEQYALAKYGGYLTSDEEGQETLVLARGRYQQIDNPHEDLTYTIGNVSVSATLEPALSPHGRAYVLTPKEAHLVKALRPELQWKTNRSSGQREWDLQASSADQADPVLGLTLLASLDSGWMDIWKREVPTDELLEPSYLPALVAIKQHDLLHSTVINRIESFMQK